MKKNKSILAIFLSLLLLNACSSVVEGLGASKKKGSDEFLVEKKAPLVLPPSFGELPKPGKKIDENVSSTEDKSLILKKIINKSSTIDVSLDSDKSSGSIEKSISEKIKKQKIKELTLKETTKKIIETNNKKNFFQKVIARFNK